MIDLDAATGKILNQKNCSIKTIEELSSDGISFTCIENALPFPVTGEQIQALKWVPFQQELNRQIIKVSHLDSGSYELKIDNISIGTYSAAKLATGINLSNNQTTPQFRQALEVKAVNDKRLAAVSKLRSIALVRYSMINKLDPPVSENDFEALKAALNAVVEKSKDKPWYDYLKNQVKIYMESAPHEDDFKLQEEIQMKKIWTVNKPRSHRWAILPEVSP